MKPLQRILHVEDVPAIQVVTRIALERVGGFQVLSCTTGQEALDRAAAFDPDMVLLDAMLPGMDGAETLRRLAGRIDLGRVAVVFLTGDIDAERLEELHQLGAREVLSKPFDPMQLPARLTAIWDAMDDDGTTEG
ncbi:response regulator [Stutzerimonas azotifigens]|uniref:response regulator n=1 Tax=Stutzerimonas azotifigens TaxID=291995 RepID=UPI0004032230|nr:response regulator [Stutzerimonas azotifigens]